MIINEGQVLAEVARWAIRQSPYFRPDNLEIVLDKLHNDIGELFKSHPLGFWDISESALRALLANSLGAIPEYVAWNDSKNGNSSSMTFISRHDMAGDPDDDFIDLYALEGNVVRSLKQEAESV